MSIEFISGMCFGIELIGDFFVIHVGIFRIMIEMK
jgi:hypothetical protein